MPTSLTKSSLSRSWTENPHRSGQRSKSDSSWASRSLPARCRRGSWLALGCVFMASKLARSGDSRVEELSATPTFSLSETGLFIISYYGLPCRLQRALEEAQMARFVISPHFRLHEWVAEEKGYFSAEGLDYEFRNVFESHATPDRVGAYTSFEKGREANVSRARHWTVNRPPPTRDRKLHAH